MNMAEMNTASPQATGEPVADFGFAPLPLGEKQGRVNTVFTKVAQRYDLMNDLMSAGWHRVWKDALVTRLNLPRSRPFRHLDVAGGTGDIALRILSRGGKQVLVDCLDINVNMLEEGVSRSRGREGLSFLAGNAENLPLADRLYDGCTIAFGIRNVPRREQALREIWRVLKPGGHFLCLEFSQVDVPGLDAFYEAWSFHAIPALGEWVTGERDPYTYLVESIRRFPSPEAFAILMRDVGFANVSYNRLSGGIVAIHSGWKV
jgi:demethylmenaquinone methyltransferase / 2-methoxy-6-polyprenyl-1,4-benzoquinol methylase